MKDQTSIMKDERKKMKDKNESWKIKDEIYQINMKYERNCLTQVPKNGIVLITGPILWIISANAS